ncbi:MAG: hypothetical protein ACOX1F_07190 [Erysipelotrichaceae bacterium]
MNNPNIYTIKLNAKYLEKWIHYIFIAVLINSFFDYFSNFSFNYGYKSIGYALYSFRICANLLIVYFFLKLAVIEPLFSKAALFLFLHILIGGTISLIPENKLSKYSLSILLMFLIIPYILNIYTEYLEYRGFTNLLKGLNDPLAKRWKTYWYTFLIANILLVIITGISAVYTNNSQDQAIFLSTWLLIISLFIIFCFIYKLVNLNKIAKFFGNMEI